MLKKISAKEEAEPVVEAEDPPFSVVVPKVDVMGDMVDIIKVDEASKAPPPAALMRE